MRLYRQLRPAPAALRRLSGPAQSTSPPKHTGSAAARPRQHKDPLPLKPSTYFDPSNKSLDFSKPNKKLLDEILKGSKRRTFLRKTKPASSWLSLHGDVPHLHQETHQLLQNATVSMDSATSPLGVGDLVLLNGKSTVLHLVVSVPVHLSSDIYRFISGEGEVVYSTKNQVKLRVPRVLSKEWVGRLRMVALERKHAGIAPIGMPDSVFSRSKLALPAPAQKHARAGKDGDDLETHSESVLQAQQMAASDESLGSESAKLANSADDFLVSQAASQLLTDTDVKTYIVPATARELFAKPLAEISIAAFAEITDFSNKLEQLHKLLQYDRHRLISSSRNFPFFELFAHVKNLKKGDKCADFATSTFNLPISKNTGAANIPISSYIAFVVALNRTSRLWKLNLQKSTKTPLSVDIIPVAKTHTLQNALEYLKGPGMEEFSTQYVESLGGASESHTPEFHTVVQLLKDFVAGNISHDNALESLSGSLIRSIDEKMRRAGLKNADPIPFANEYSKARAYEIIVSLEKDVNPIVWDESVALPGNQSSYDADHFSEYYEFLDRSLREHSLQELLGKQATSVMAEQLKSDFFLADPMESVREDFGNTPVYCIDSATAHEIDDGISINDVGTHYEITVHVANPTSYLKPDSSICQIALHKGTTTYLPERAVAMLPQFISKVCGLNGNAATRTLGIQYRLAKATVDGFLDIAANDAQAKPEDAMAAAVLSDIADSAQVKFFSVSNFPKDQTYENVNKTLDDTRLEAAFFQNQLQDPHARNLFLLHNISKLLRHARISINEGFEINSERTRVKVDYKNEKSGGPFPTESGWSVVLPTNHGDSAVVTVERDVHQHSESKSQQLVSNFMIAGNYAGSVFAQKNGVPIIRRTQKMELSKQVKKAVARLNQRAYQNSVALSMEEMSQVLSVMVAANDEISLRPHETLGLNQYSKFTSPLRRFVDMVNHWQMQSHVLGSATGTAAVFAAKDLVPVASHLQSCESTSKRAQRFSDQFWTGRFLKEVFQSGGRLDFAFLLRSDAKYGDVRADLLAKDPQGKLMGFAIKTIIAKNDFVTEKFAAGEFAEGQVVEARFRVVHLDYIENELVVELTR